MLRDLLADTADVALIETSERALRAPADPQRDRTTPQVGTTLVLFEPDGGWEILAGALHPERIVVRLPRDDPETLLRCLARLQEAWPHAALQFTLPHAQISGGDAQHRPVEYPWIDPALFAVAPARTESSLVVGRPGPAAPGDDHPNDGALYRALIADGHRVAVPETPFLRSAFAEQAMRPTLTGEHDAGSGLEAFDVMLFRGAHNLPGSADARVLEAMAAARPVVAFAHSVGAREWIVNARTGFIVNTDDEARQCIAQLARSRDLRQEIGSAARQLAIAAMGAQRPRARAFYLGVSLNV